MEFETKNSTSTFAASKAMLKYMMERAEWLSEQTQINDSQFNDGWKAKKEELSRILEIIKAAGVEVLNEQ